MKDLKIWRLSWNIHFVRLTVTTGSLSTGIQVAVTMEAEVKVILL